MKHPVLTAKMEHIVAVGTTDLPVVIVVTIPRFKIMRNLVTPDELLLMIAERAQQRNIAWHIENYPATRSAAERLLRTMAIVPTQRALPVADSTQLLPLYQRGIARYER